VDISDGVIDLQALCGFFDRATLDLPDQTRWEDNELSLLERLGDTSEIALGVSAVSFGTDLLGTGSRRAII
jgi:hypothetical protein